MRYHSLSILGTHLIVLEQDLVKEAPIYLTLEMQNIIYSIIYILKYDSVERVSLEAARIWQLYVDNQPIVLKKCISNMLELSLTILSKDSAELKDMG